MYQNVDRVTKRCVSTCRSRYTALCNILIEVHRTVHQHVDRGAPRCASTCRSRYTALCFIRRYIYGFISREEAEALLKEKPVGTFLLRFSETLVDGLATRNWRRAQLTMSIHERFHNSSEWSSCGDVDTRALPQFK